MKLVPPTRTSTKLAPVMENFQGLNRLETISLYEFEDMENLSSDSYPSISPRGSRELIRTLTKANGYLIYEGNHYYVDGTTLYKDGVAKGTVTDSEKQLVIFNDYLLIFPDKKVFDIPNEVFTSMPSGIYPDVVESVPAVDYITTHMNRVFGIKDRNVYASEQGQYGTWARFEGLLTDSYATDIESGSLKALITYANHVVMFTESQMYELYGYNPSNFQIQQVYKEGCVNDKSIVELKSVLYFANQQGIFAYSGGVPRLISEKLYVKIVDAICGTDGEKLYASIYDGSNWTLYSYKPNTQNWYKEDESQVKYFANNGNSVFAVFSDGKVYKFNSGTEQVNWSFRTGSLIDSTLKTKSLKKLTFLADMELGASMFVYAWDGREEVPVGRITSKKDRVVNLPVFLKPMALYKIIVRGKGKVKIKAIQRVVALK